jgi:hypothetical protein
MYECIELLELLSISVLMFASLTDFCLNGLVLSRVAHGVLNWLVSKEALGIEFRRVAGRRREQQQGWQNSIA